MGYLYREFLNGILFLYSFLPIFAICNTASGTLISPPAPNFYAAEIALLAQLKSRLTGSTSHTKFIDHLEQELESMGLKVYSDYFEFEYNEPPSTPLAFSVDGQSVPPSSYIPYSGNTGPGGVSGKLVHIAAASPPDWTPAAGNIAVMNVSNTPLNGALLFPVWPGSQTWGQFPGVPASVAISNLTAAAAVGVKGIIYNWVNMSSLNAFGQYVPFKLPFQGIPAAYVTNQALSLVKYESGSIGSLSSTGQLLHNRTTRTLYTVFKGSELKNESIILSTHTDGTNAVEENGHIALLAKAMELIHSPPRRTTVLVFVTGHLHTPGFTSTGRVMERWLQDHPQFWAGNTSSATKAVFGSCVEHLGAVHWLEDVPNNLYYPTGTNEDEFLYAATSQLASLVERTWEGANPGVLRVINPIKSLVEQSGEGLPYLWNNIPEISLCTSPDWLLKIWPADFDESQLMDVSAVMRQVESFLRIWRVVDSMEASELGTVNYTRTPQGL